MRKAVARGITEAQFGHFSGAVPTLGGDGTYKIAPEKVRYDLSATEDEIDLESGFIMLPSAIPKPATPTLFQPPSPDGITGTEEPVLTTPPTVPPGGDGVEVPDTLPDSSEKIVQISFSADRNALFTAWNAMANLADLAGKVTVTVKAESAEGYDKGKLQNGVMEPLREADLIE